MLCHRILGVLLVLLVPRAALAINTVDTALEALESWQLEDAKEAAERFLGEDPDNPEVLYLAARVQHARGEHLSALSLVKAAAEGGVEEAKYYGGLIEHSATYAAAFSTLAAYSQASQLTIRSSPESASTWNSCDMVPPIAPVSASTARNRRPQRLKMRV